MKYAKAAHSDMIFCVPSFVEVIYSIVNLLWGKQSNQWLQIWSKSEEDVAFLKSIRGIVGSFTALRKGYGIDVNCSCLEVDR